VHRALTLALFSNAGAELKDLLRRFVSQPVERVVELINPVLRGWVNYFAIGDASRRFGFVKDWVERKVRRHLMRARKLRASAGRGGISASCTRS
jgi:RNA-directed DNA polymerase